ncbi:MAG: sulfite exporter TauE/SafE family protein [Alcanivorax sp.]
MGGGSLTVPFLSWCRLKMQEAVAISSACGLPIAVAGTLGFAVAGWNEQHLPEGALGYVFLPASVGIVLTSFPFARLSARLSHRLPSATLKKVFALVLFVLGLKLAFG